MNFENPTRNGETWTIYEIEELKLSYKKWLLENSKKHGRAPFALEVKLGVKSFNSSPIPPHSPPPIPQRPVTTRVPPPPPGF